MALLDDVAHLDATAQAGLVRRREVQPIELVDAAIERIERLNPALNAVITPMYDEARAAATGELPAGPFAGVPFLLKDFLAEYAGVRFTESSAFLGDYVSTEDSELVRRFKRSGLLTVGKTNTPELALGATTEPRRFGRTRNPWDTTRTAGGSSGGAAAAVAARMVPVAHGNDAGGSIRIPASCCGVFGLKPTRGRNPLGPNYGDLFSGLVAEHALTISVRDSATLLDATAGSAIGDPYWAPPTRRSFAEEAGFDPEPLHIAVSETAPLGSEVHPDCVGAVRDAAALCAELGHHVVEDAPSYNEEGLWLQFTNMMAAGFAWSISDLGRRIGRTPTDEDFEPAVWDFAERGRQLNAADYLLALQDVQRFTREIAQFFARYDAWLTPTLGAPPVPLGSLRYTEGDAFALRRRIAAFVPFTYVSNATGQPAMSVPLFWNDDGLPIGTHFVGPFGGEATLFRLAGQLEAARSWAGRLPPISAVT
ncbi:MAG: amidase [Dehalococcoidia bacterium]|nr:amidase [Dehalococcoidia bacterium]